MLSMFCNTRQTDWDRCLNFVLFAYRTTTHSSTQESPAFLLYGRDLRFPSDVAFQFRPSPYIDHTEDYATFMKTILTQVKGPETKSLIPKGSKNTSMTREPPLPP